MKVLIRNVFLSIRLFFECWGASYVPVRVRKGYRSK